MTCMQRQNLWNVYKHAIIDSSDIPSAWPVCRSVWWIRPAPAFPLVLQKQFIPPGQDNHESMHKILWIIARKLIPLSTAQFPRLQSFQIKLGYLPGSHRFDFLCSKVSALSFSYRFIFGNGNSTEDFIYNKRFNNFKLDKYRRSFVNRVCAFVRS